MKRGWRPLLLLIPLLIVLALFLVIPLYYMIISSFKVDGSNAWSFSNYTQSISNPYYYQAFTNSALIALVSSVIGLIGSLIFCHSLLCLPKKTQERLTLMSNLAANFAGVPLAFGFIIMLGNAGVLKVILPFLSTFDLYSWKGLVVTYVYFQIPLASLFLYPVVKKIKQEWQESAELFGASSVYYWRRVVLPFMAPSLTGTFVILFANGMGTYETAYALVGSNINLVTTRISALVAGDVYAKPNIGSALSVIFALSMVSVIVLSQKVMNRVQKGRD